MVTMDSDVPNYAEALISKLKSNADRIMNNVKELALVENPTEKEIHEKITLESIAFRSLADQLEWHFHNKEAIAHRGVK